MSDSVSKTDVSSVLKRRAQRLAQGTNQERERASVAKVTVVTIGDQQVGIPASGLREIVPLPRLTALPGMPPWLLGVAQVRGELLGVVDMKRLLEITGGELSALAIVDTAQGAFALAVDRVVDFRHVHADDLAEQLADPSRPFSAVCKDLVALLDLERLTCLTGGTDPSQSSQPHGGIAP
jgi:chemotaxis signal transduction protein